MKKHKKRSYSGGIAHCRECGELIRIDGRLLPNCTKTHCPGCAYIGKHSSVHKTVEKSYEKTPVLT